MLSCLCTRLLSQDCPIYRLDHSHDMLYDGASSPARLSELPTDRRLGHGHDVLFDGASSLARLTLRATRTGHRPQNLFWSLWDHRMSNRTRERQSEPQTRQAHFDVASSVSFISARSSWGDYTLLTGLDVKIQKLS